MEQKAVYSADVDYGTYNARKMKNFKFVDGDNIYRIMPPFGTDHQGSLFHYWALHWNFKDHRGQTRPLVCTYDQYKICPICNVANEFYKEMTDIVAPYTTEQADGKKVTDWKSIPKEVLDKYNEVKDKYSGYKSQRGYFYLAANQQGEIGVLMMNKKRHLETGELLQKFYRNYNINPVSLLDNQGIWLNYNRKRTGTGKMDVEYSVDYSYIDSFVNGVPQRNFDFRPLAPSIVSNFERLATDVHTMYKLRSPEDLNRIMSGDCTPFVEEEKEILAKRNPRGGVAQDHLALRALGDLTKPAPSTVGQAPATVTQTPTVGMTATTPVAPPQTVVAPTVKPPTVTVAPPVVTPPVVTPPAVTPPFVVPSTDSKTAVKDDSETITDAKLAEYREMLDV